MMCIAFSSCRLYSSMRFTCTSNSDAGSTVTPRHLLIVRASCAFFISFTSGRTLKLRDHRRAAPGAAARRARAGQPSPMARVIKRGELGIRAEQPAPRRHAVRLVVETSSGHSVWKSGISVVLMSFECSSPRRRSRRGCRRWPGSPCARTPGPSSMSDIGAACRGRPGSTPRRRSRKRELISWMICRCRGSTLLQQRHGHRLERFRRSACDCV